MKRSEYFTPFSIYILFIIISIIGQKGSSETECLIRRHYLAIMRILCHEPNLLYPMHPENLLS
jgi:hypothetical protein